MNANVFENVRRALLNFDIEGTCEQVRQGLAAGTDPIELMEAGLTTGMAVIGERFADGDLFLPELMIGAEAMKAGVQVIKPAIAARGDARTEARPMVVVGTVKGDIHDVGLSIVQLILETAGYRVLNLGTDVAAEQFVESAKTHGAVAVGMSALLTTTIIEMDTVITALSEAGLRKDVTVMVGGSSVSQEYARQIGADIYGVDAVDGMRKLKAIAGRRV